MIKNISYTMVGILLAVVFGLAWDLHVLNKNVNGDHALLAQVVSFLQSPQKSSPQAAAATGK